MNPDCRSSADRRSIPCQSGAIICCLLAMLLIGCDEDRPPKAVWCEAGRAPGQVLYPRGIAYSPQRDVFFVVDRAARVQRLGFDGVCQADWQLPLWQLGKPVGLTVGPDGNVYVPDTHYSRVMVYSPDGQLLNQWGSYGKDPGQFVWPTDVAFDGQGSIYVSEYGDNDRVQVFAAPADIRSDKPRWLRQFGSFGSGDGQFIRPQSLVIDGQRIYVADASNHRISIWTTSGAYQGSFGRAGSGLGEFRFPYGLDMDAKGRLVVCEFGNNRVQLVDKQTGRGLRTWGRAGREPGQLAYPWAVAVDRRGRVVVVDSGNNRMQVFSF